MMPSFTEVLSRFRLGTEGPAVYANLLYSAVTSLAVTDQEIIRRCDADAECLHAGQVRSDGAPYIVHPRRVAILVAAYSGERPSAARVLIALAHDLIEDCGTTNEWLRDRYGTDIASGVGLLSAPSSSGESSSQRRDRKAAKYVALASAAPDVLAVHAMDVLDNTISWRFIPPGAPGRRKIPRWIWQVLEYQIPLLSARFGDVAAELMKEIDYQRSCGFEVGSWESP